MGKAWLKHYDGRNASKHRNAKRTAEKWCQRAGATKSARVPLLIEFPAHSASTFAQHIARKNGYAIRLSAYRKLETALRKQRKLPPVTTRKAMEAPTLHRGRAVTWKLDIRNVKHRQKFLHFLHNLRIPAEVSLVHLHSSPPCGRACSLVPMNEAKGAEFVESKDDFLTRLQWVRKCHLALRKTCRRAGVTQTSSHEQSNTCRLQYVSDTEKDWPWAISADSALLQSKSIAVVHGCAFGMPVKKKWRFETNNFAMLTVLKKLVCPGCASHKKIVDHGTKASERYPCLLGCTLAEACPRQCSASSH